MMQYSVYIRHCASFENAQIHAKRMGLIYMMPDNIK